MKIRPDGADLIHEDRLDEFAKSSKNMQRELCDNYCLKTVNFPFTLYGTVPKSAVFPLVTVRHNTVLKPYILHYNTDNSKATS